MMKKYANKILSIPGRAAPAVLFLLAIGNSQLAPALFEWDGWLESASFSAIPKNLSQLGFDPAKTNIFIPYKVNVPQYRTHFGMNRYVYVPQGQKIIPDDSLYYQFPPGTVLFRHIYVDTVYNDPASRQWLELQVQVRSKDSAWGHLSYCYKENSTDAVLVDADALIEKSIKIKNIANLQYFNKADTVAPKITSGLTIPFVRSAYDCGQCHFSSSTNGFFTQQLNTGGQLAELAAKGILAPTLNLGAMAQAGKITQWYPLTHPTATLDQKARSYLAANCGCCHSHEEERAPQSESIYNYFTFSTSLENFSLEAIIPGDPANSSIVERTRIGEMPSGEINGIPDITGTKMLWDWIGSLGGANVPFPGIFVNVKPHHRRLQPKLSVRIEGGIFFIDIPGASPLSEVRAFTVSGKEIGLETVAANRYAAKNALSPGIYLIKVNQSTLLSRYLGP